MANIDIRAAYRDILNSILSQNKKFNELPTERKETICRRIERACLNKVIKECEIQHIGKFWTNKQFVERYCTEMYRQCANLDPKSVVGSNYYADQLLGGKMRPEDAAKYSNDELNPAASMAERNAIEIRRAQKITPKYSDKYPCGRCKSKRVQYWEMHKSLGADEITQFKFICNDCGNIWH